MYCMLHDVNYKLELYIDDAHVDEDMYTLGAYELPKAAKECVTTVPSKYKLHSQAIHSFGSSHSHHRWMSSLCCKLN